MYRVFCDNYKLYDSRLDKYKLAEAQLDLELNKTGSFSFTIYPDHPNFNRLQKLKSIITVYQDDYLLFRGRILDTESGFYNETQVICEGELAFLLDSIIRPYGTEASPWTGTPAEYLTKLITEHNAQVDGWKQFKVGTITVDDGDTSNNLNQINRLDTEYKTTWQLINEKLITPLGGYLWVRHEDDGNYIDYLADFDILSNQKIEFGKNLLDLRKKIKGEEVMSGIIPLGAKPENADGRITIATVNDGKDYIENAEAVAAYGKIFKTVIWDDVTDPTNLKTKAEAYLADSVNFNVAVELTAADLAGITGVNPFRLGRYIIVKSVHHGLDTLNSDLEFLVKKLSLDILNPAANKLAVGTTYQTFTESTGGAEKAQGEIIQRLETVEKHVAESGVTNDQLDHAIAQVTEQTSSAVNQSADEIMARVASDYYLKSDADSLVASVNTRFTQTDSEFEYRFNEFMRDIASVESGADARFNEISKYIRFIDGNIILGEDGNELTLKIENDRIAFLEGGAEVAYFSNRKLYVLDGEYVNQLTIGKYAFIPRANGNLSFKKVK